MELDFFKAPVSRKSGQFGHISSSFRASQNESQFMNKTALHITRRIEKNKLLWKNMPTASCEYN